MSKVKVAINGMGRIGRTLVREWALRSEQNFEIVAVNNPGVREQYVHLLKYDSLHGIFPESVSLEKDALVLGNRRITFFNEKDPSQIDWNREEVDIVIDSSGKFRDKASLSKHLGGTVKKVILCAPGKDVDTTLVWGVNHESYTPKTQDIISNASCTTNCLAPIAKILDAKFGIESGVMTTVHSYTADQSLLDSAHSDLRRARAAGVSMIPTSTGAAKALGLVLPKLKGKLDGLAVRVPTPNVSLVDLSVHLSRMPSIEELNGALIKASQEEFRGVLSCTELPLVSSDLMGTKESSIVDLPLTQITGQLAKIVAWYDNEVGFSNRVLDLAGYVGEKL